MVKRKTVWVLFPKFCEDTKRWKRGSIYREICGYGGEVQTLYYEKAA
jgi:hypothetical protein